MPSFRALAASSLRYSVTPSLRYSHLFPRCGCTALLFCIGLCSLLEKVLRRDPERLLENGEQRAGLFVREALARLGKKMHHEEEEAAAQRDEEGPRRLADGELSRSPHQRDGEDEGVGDVDKGVECPELGMRPDEPVHPGEVAFPFELQGKIGGPAVTVRLDDGELSMIAEHPAGAAMLRPACMLPEAGDAIRRSFDRALKKFALHMIGAWAHQNRLVFGQLATEAKSNEITAIPKLLAMLDLRSTIVTIDAIGCQKAIARQIIEQGGDYVLQVKSHHPVLHDEVKLLFDEAIEHDFQHMSHAATEQQEADHGRIERRRTWTTSEVAWFRERNQWPGLRSFACVESTRQIKAADELSVERRYDLSSLDGTDARLMADTCRGHWGIENRLDWLLDVSFGEDQSRIRKGHGAANFSRHRRIALNMLKREATSKRGVKAKRLRAGWDHNYLLKVLAA